VREMSNGVTTYWKDEDWWDKFYEKMILELLGERFQYPGRDLFTTFAGEAAPFYVGTGGHRALVSMPQYQAAIKQYMDRSAMENMALAQRAIQDIAPSGPAGSVEEMKRAQAAQTQAGLLSNLAQWQFGQAQPIIPQTGALIQNEWVKALGGLMGFRGQDIELLMRELQAQEQLAGTRAQAGAAEGRDGGMCIVTSACMKAKGLPDDCHELESLRKLRSWMSENLSDGSKMIAQYEALAPKIVKKINESANPEAIWNRIYEQFIRPAVNSVEEGAPDMDC